MLQRRKWKQVIVLVVCVALLVVVNAEVQQTENEGEHSSREDAQGRKLSRACQSHSQALQLISTLQPTKIPPQTRSASRNVKNAKYELEREYADDEGGFISMGPVTNFFKIFLKLLSSITHSIFIEPFPFLHSFFSRITAFLHIQNVFHSISSRGGETSRETVVGKEVVKLLREATEPVWEGEEACDDAWTTRGMVYLIPPQGVKRDLNQARLSFEMAATSTSNPLAQFMLGFIHSAGIGGIERDQGKALLYYTFSAIQGFSQAQMALGYRYWSGIGVKENCLEALEWYEGAAEKAYAHFLSGPPGGRTLPLTPTKQSDLSGGVFGPGASWASTGLNSHRAVIKASNAAASGEKYDDVLEYYQYHSDRGSHRETVILGRIFYLGSVYTVPGGIASGAEGVGSVTQDFVKARNYFLKVARAMWPADPPLIQISAHGVGDGLPEGFGAKVGVKQMSKDSEASLHGPAGIAAGFLGRMYLRGEGVEKDYLMARMWLKRASDLGDREAHNLIGIVYRDGLGVRPMPPIQYIKYFQAAASQDLADAKVQLAKYHLGRNEVELGVAYLNQAIQQGNSFEAFYELAKIHAHNARSEGSTATKNSGNCAVAVSFFKVAAERGNWQYNSIGEGDQAWQAGDRMNALSKWWIAAEMGYEVALNDVAFVLDRARSIKASNGLTSAPIMGELVNDTEFLALSHWTRSAAQQNIDALVKVGDYYYDGVGVASYENRFEKAAAWYQSAAETQASAIAFWNLGWMYENGLGVPQDWHLAKRYYDLCRETNAEAYLPVILSLIKLHVRSWWSSMTGGKQKRLRLFGSDEDEGDDVTNAEAKPARSRARNAITQSDEAEQEDGSDIGHYRADGQRDDDEPTDWMRRRDWDDNIRAGEEGYDEQVGVRRRAGRQHGSVGEERENEMMDDFVEIEIDEELVETVAIGLLCVGLTSLLYLRGRWMRRRREQEEDEVRRRGGGDRPVPDVDQDEQQRLREIPIDFAPLPI